MWPQTFLARLSVPLVLVAIAVFGFSASAYAGTKTFTPEESGQPFAVPAGVATIKVEAIGGAGEQAYEHFCHGESGPPLEEVVEAKSRGDGSAGNAPGGEEAFEVPAECYGQAPLGSGGSGARVIATLDVSPGESLVVHFGPGGEGSAAGTGHEADYIIYGKGGGGSELLSGTSTPLVVAAGGGGGGSTRGGSAEGFIGGDGEGESAGKGGTISEGGASGTVGFQGPENGSKGRGGNGFLGGGGGDGYYGGGGGFFGGGGGAGSSFIVPGASGTVSSGAGLAQRILISYTVRAATCTANSATITLSPGLTDTPALQRMKIKGTLSGCTGEPFTAATYTATLKTAGPVSCSVLKASGESAAGEAKYKWTPKAKASKGTLNLLLSEAPGIALSGGLGSGPYSPLGLSGLVAERYTNAATCGLPQGRRGVVKAVSKGTFSGSALDFE
jgi:hypothetical protein